MNIFDPYVYRDSESVVIAREESWRRALKWFFFRRDWFLKYQAESNVVQVFRIPRAAIEKIVLSEGEPRNDALFFFGLSKQRKTKIDPDPDPEKDPEIERYMIDLLVSSITNVRFNLPENYKNLTRSCPPFDCDKFGLLQVL